MTPGSATGARAATLVVTILPAGTSYSSRIGSASLPDMIVTVACDARVSTLPITISSSARPSGEPVPSAQYQATDSWAIES